METSEVLNKAADLIEERGWADWTVDSTEAWGEYSRTSPLCIEGGIIAALGWGDRAFALTDVAFCPAYRAVHKYLDLHNGLRLFTFNDDKTRTASEVIEVLRAAALIESAREREAAQVSA